MGLTVNQNIGAVNAHRNLSNTQGDLGRSLEKLSSGLRINRAADDAAGLAISEGLRSQANGLKVAIRNTQDGISVLQTTEGALTETHAILQRMRDLSVQGSNEGAVDAGARSAINTELTQLKGELDRIASTTQFNGRKLLDGTYYGLFQVGANGGEIVTTGTLGGADSTTLNVTAVDVSDFAHAQTSIQLVDTAIKAISTGRAILGGLQNRLEHTVKNLSVAVENLSASESRIRDTDMASEMVSFTKNQILSQAGVSMLAQANQTPQSVLKLLG